MSTLVSTVMMATLVVGPFYLSRGLGLETALCRTRVVGWSACRRADRCAGWSHGGSLWRTAHDHHWAGRNSGRRAVLAMLPASFGVAGYIAPMVVITASYALFQAANNTVS